MRLRLVARVMPSLLKPGRRAKSLYSWRRVSISSQLSAGAGPLLFKKNSYGAGIRSEGSGSFSRTLGGSGGASEPGREMAAELRMAVGW